MTVVTDQMGCIFSQQTAQVEELQWLLCEEKTKQNWWNEPHPCDRFGGTNIEKTF